MATQTVKAVDHKLLAAGEWIETSEWGEVKSPYDGTVVGRVAEGDAALVDRAAKAAQEVFETADFPQHERAAVLDRAAHLVGERTEDLALTIAAEAGKPLKTATVEAERCVDTLTFSATEARKLTGGTVPMAASVAGVGKLGVMLRVPYGVVGAISPFNFPLNLVAHKLGPAIAAGNAVVLKPAGATPISALKLAAVLLEAGLPEGWLSVIPGPGSEVGNAIVEHELTRALSFTGSAEVGWGIRSKVPHKKVNLELGSNAPLIVNADGDWETAADKAQIHAFSHAGQSCISIQRMLIHEDIADVFTERLVANVKKLTVGDPRETGTRMGPLIHPDAFRRVTGFVDRALADGARPLWGGKKHAFGDLYFEPTLLTDVRQDMEVVQREVFGPVLTWQTFSDESELIELANGTKYGLAAVVFTRDEKRAWRVSDRLVAGSLWVNCFFVRDLRAPFGGARNSGIGREGGDWSMDFYCDVKNISILKESFA